MTPLLTMEPSPAIIQALAGLAEAISHAPDPAAMQALVVKEAVSLLRAEGGSVLLPREGSGEMRVAASIGLPSGKDGGGPPESRVADWVVRNNKPALLIGRSGPLAGLLRREDVRDAVCVPLRYEGHAIGALSVRNSRRRRAFQPEDVEILTAVGRLAAVALKSAALHAEVRDHRERLREMVREIWTTQEAERRSLASDLHDGPAQTLAHVAFRLQTARGQMRDDPTAALATLEQAEAAVRETLAQVRGLMTGLRPIVLDDLGLVSALKNDCENMAARGRVKVTVRVTGLPRRLGAEREMALFRIVREALANVERHAETDRALLELRFDPDALTITVTDHGRGFDAAAERTARRAGHLGLSAIRERIDALGGQLDIHSECGRGTRLRIVCPYPGGKTGPEQAGESH